jgi:hypothetical protein
MIKMVKMFDGEFHGARTAYSSNSIFIAILTNPGVKYDFELIGEKIFPEGFGCINPPGPGFGFGDILLSDDEESGLVTLSSLKNRLNGDGKKLTKKALKESLEEYFDAFFVVEKSAKHIRQVEFDFFYQLLNEGKDYELVQICEFEPDQDNNDEDEDEESDDDQSDEQTPEPLLKPSVALGALIGFENVTQTDAVSKFWEYVKAKGLTDPENSMRVVADEKLKVLCDGDSVTMFAVPDLISSNLSE